MYVLNGCRAAFSQAAKLVTMTMIPPNSVYFLRHAQYALALGQPLLYIYTCKGDSSETL